MSAGMSRPSQSERETCHRIGGRRELGKGEHSMDAFLHLAAKHLSSMDVVWCGTKTGMTKKDLDDSQALSISGIRVSNPWRREWSFTPPVSQSVIQDKRNAFPTVAVGKRWEPYGLEKTIR